MTSENLSWKERCIWLVVLSFVILVTTATIGFVARDNQVAAYLSFASALASIVLAVVAITYTIVQGLQSHQNVGEMKRLVEEGHNVFERHAASIEQSSKVVADRAEALMGFMDSGAATDSVEVSAEGVASQPELIMDLSLLVNGTLLCLYALGIAWREGITISTIKCADLFYSEGRDISEPVRWGFKGFICATADMLSAHLGAGSMRVSAAVIEVCELPEEFLALVEAEYNRRVENGKFGRLTERFKQMPDRIHELQCD